MLESNIRYHFFLLISYIYCFIFLPFKNVLEKDLLKFLDIKKNFIVKILEHGREINYNEHPES